MITKEQVYAATNGGLDIICLHYPEAREAAARNTKFKVRAEERTPSACVKRFGDVWRMTDFGGDGRAISPIQIHMDAMGLTFYEAILDLAARFNITTGDIDRSVNKPRIEEQQATAEQKDGTYFWELEDGFTEAQCKVMGPLVKPEHLEALHWHVAKFVARVYNRRVIYEYSTEHYPIFMRECWFEAGDGKEDCFYKIYKPLNPEKQFRFSYQPSGKKPRYYVNGLKELRQAWTKANEADERAWTSDPANEGCPFKPKKLPEAVICSGERDSLCVRSLGYHPVWFNSETYKPSAQEMGEIRKYVEEMYNIPDIDATGKLKGSELALSYLDIKTVWLPEKLSTMRDNRGKPRKDFRDWIEIYPEKRCFQDLLNLATRARFWDSWWEEKKGEKFVINPSALHNFLDLNGFFTLHDEHVSATRFIKITGHTVKEVTPKQIRAFLLNWSKETGQKEGLRNLLLTTTLLSALSLEPLQETAPDFRNYTRTSQFFYFPDFAAEVTPTGIIKHDAKRNPTGRFVWQNKVIDHRLSLMEDMFEISHPEGRTESDDFDIKILNDESSYFRYLINSSRIYWREELETGLENASREEAREYREKHKFDIAGPKLNQSQIAEQKQCLISKMFAIGYIMHRYKSPERAWAPFAMDNVIGQNGQCNGRSGKSFMFTVLSNFMNYVKLSGRNPRLLENAFAFEQVNKDTDLVLVDDCDEYLPIRQFYDSMSSDMTVNAKNVSSYNLKFEEAPKFAFTTNYVPKEFDPSSRQRMLYLVFSDYYHERTEENDYLETRQISTDFGGALFQSDYPEEKWAADINFIMQCVKFYLSLSSLPVKIEPKLDRIIFRKELREMSDSFRDWAEGYFAEGGDHLDKMLVRESVFEDYKRNTNIGKTTSQRFLKSLKAFCYTCEWVHELNPEEYQNSSGRILQRVDVQGEDTRQQKEMIYVRSAKAAEAAKEEAARPKQTEIEMTF